MNWNTNSFSTAPFEQEKKKYHFVTTCSCVRTIHYTSGILVKIIHLSQFFFHMLILTKPWRDWMQPIINDTHRERLVLHSIHYRNDWLAASDVFDMFTQWIKFYTFHEYRCLKNVNHQIDNKNGWLLLSASFRAKFGLVFRTTFFLRGFIFKPTERA